ncbi:MAG: HD domain-containing protein [Methanosarcinaceae archaeon]|nr:HD domain-containing protein [Methanosarcinaceae archaeon]
MRSMAPDDITFHRNIYDNVHGFIKVTELENKIIDSPYFQRLRNIRQLGLLDYVFPGALHNRFNHSLGVMHIADKMVTSLQEKNYNILDNKRELIRMAALLHDIGHYPLSHLVESVVLKDAESKIKTTDISLEGEECNNLNLDDNEVNLDDNDAHMFNYDLHRSRNPSGDFANHERIASIVISKTPIYDILIDKFDDDQIKDIEKIIAGGYSGPEGLIIHSELDADRFDYLLRDSKQTGVTYGLFDIDQIIRNLKIYEPEDNRLVVDEKGRKAVEHYLMSRYFLYSTVIYQKATIGFELMAKKVYQGLMERKKLCSYFDLIDIFKDHDSAEQYLNYDDSYFFNTIKRVHSGKIKWDYDSNYKVSDDLLLDLIEKILTRTPLKMVRENQKIMDRNSSDSKPFFLEKAVGDKLASSAGIEDHWYITSEINVSLTNIGPYRSWSEVTNDSSYEDPDYKSIRILKNTSLEHATKLLVEDETSIIKTLSKSKLYVGRLYTKDASYKEKLDAAFIDYEMKR